MLILLAKIYLIINYITYFPGEFDMRVKSCAASDGGGHLIQLSDEYGCVLRPKMISRFLKARAADERASVITYAFFHAFKFPDALSVHIKCKVEICRHGCLDHCQEPGNAGLQEQGLDHGLDVGLEQTLGNYGGLERKDQVQQNENEGDDLLYDDIVQEGDDVANIGGQFNTVNQQSQQKNSNKLQNKHSYDVHENPEVLPPQAYQVTVFLK